MLISFILVYQVTPLFPISLHNFPWKWNRNENFQSLVCHICCGEKNPSTSASNVYRKIILGAYKIYEENNIELKEKQSYRTKSVRSRTKMSFCSQKFSAYPFLLDRKRRITLTNLENNQMNGVKQNWMIYTDIKKKKKKLYTAARAGCDHLCFQNFHASINFGDEIFL